MSTRLPVMMVIALLLVMPLAQAAGPRALLIEARNLAYDANYRNDASGLRSAIESLQPLVESAEVSAYAHYYLSWTYWSLSAAQLQAKDRPGALQSANRAAEHARAALAQRHQDPEFHVALGNALISVVILDRHQSGKVPAELVQARSAELVQARQRALELGPDNPRVMMLDAGITFFAPPERGGGQERGVARWQEALRLFETEANAGSVDPIAPRWGHALASGWIANLYLQMNPPQKENARRATEAALRMRPDFWYMREQVLPQLRE